MPAGSGSVRSPDSDTSRARRVVACDVTLVGERAGLWVFTEGSGHAIGHDLDAGAHLAILRVVEVARLTVELPVVYHRRRHGATRHGAGAGPRRGAVTQGRARLWHKPNRGCWAGKHLQASKFSIKQLGDSTSAAQTARSAPLLATSTCSPARSTATMAIAAACVPPSSCGCPHTNLSLGPSSADGG